MMFHFDADWAHDGKPETGLVGSSESESIKRVTVAIGKHERARQISFRVDDAPREPPFDEATLCRIAIAQALSSPGLYGAERLEQPEAQLNFQIPPWEGVLTSLA